MRSVRIPLSYFAGVDLGDVEVLQILFETDAAPTGESCSTASRSCPSGSVNECGAQPWALGGASV